MLEARTYAADAPSFGEGLCPGARQLARFRPSRAAYKPVGKLGPAAKKNSFSQSPVSRSDLLELEASTRRFTPTKRTL